MALPVHSEEDGNNWRPKNASAIDGMNHQNTPAVSEGGPHAWVVTISAAAVLFVGVGYTNTFGVFQDYYQGTLFPEIPADKIIVIGSVGASLYFILGALAGRFSDFFGYRISLVLGSALMIGSMFAASAARQYYELFLSQGLMFGLGVAFVYPPATTISRQYFAQKHGVANGIVVSGGALGGCILPYSVRQMIETYGLAATFRILGYLAIGILVPAVALLRQKRKAVGTSNHRAPIVDLSLLSDIRFVALLVACTIAMTGFLPRYFLIPSSAISRGIDSTYASWLLSLMNGLSILGRIGIGYVADRFGKVNALAASFILCGLGHFIFWLPGVTINVNGNGAPTALFTLFVVYIGIFGSGFISLFPVVVAHLFGKDALASKTGLLNTSIGLSVLAGPSAVYAIIDDGKQTRWMAGVLASGLFLFVGGLILFFAALAMNKHARKGVADEQNSAEIT